MILRVCEACEKVAPAGSRQRDPDVQAAVATGNVLPDGIGSPAGWVHLRWTFTEDDQEAARYGHARPVDLCSPRCLRVWAQATADDLVARHPELEELEADAAARRARGDLGGGDLVPYQHRAGAPTVLFHRRRLEAVDALPSEPGELAPNPAFVGCPWCAASPMVACHNPEVVAA